MLNVLIKIKHLFKKKKKRIQRRWPGQFAVNSGFSLRWRGTARFPCFLSWAPCSPFGTPSVTKPLPGPVYGRGCGRWWCGEPTHGWPASAMASLVRWNPLFVHILVSFQKKVCRSVSCQWLSTVLGERSFFLTRGWSDTCNRAWDTSQTSLSRVLRRTGFTASAAQTPLKYLQGSWLMKWSFLPRSQGRDKVRVDYLQHVIPLRGWGGCFHPGGLMALWSSSH